MMQEACGPVPGNEGILFAYVFFHAFDVNERNHQYAYPADAS